MLTTAASAQPRVNSSVSTQSAASHAGFLPHSIQHGLTGQAVALPNETVAEVESRFATFRDELQPRGSVSLVLVRRAAFLSVRLDRCVSHETASLQARIRQAEADFVAPAGADAATVAQLRAEAMALAMFDPSPEATLARRFEAAAERSLFRALRELRQLRQPVETSNPAVDPAEFNALLASFSQFDSQCEAFEAKNFPEDLRTYSRAARPLDSVSMAPPSRPVDVPITVGRRR